MSSPISRAIFEGGGGGGAWGDICVIFVPPSPLFSIPLKNFLYTALFVAEENANPKLASMHRSRNIFFGGGGGGGGSMKVQKGELFVPEFPGLREAQPLPP